MKKATITVTAPDDKTIREILNHICEDCHFKGLSGFGSNGSSYEFKIEDV